MIEGTTIDLSEGYALNVLPVRSGDKSEWRVRDGFRRVLTPSDVSGMSTFGKIHAGYSAQHPITEETWHYLVVNDGGSLGSRVIIMSEDMSTVIQELSFGTSVSPRTVSFATAQNQVFISSPDFATLWGWIGGPLVVAQKLDGINTGSPYIDIPQGLLAGWAGRLVIAQGNSIFFSDPLRPRSFAGNILIGEWSGPVYGLHVTDDGTLVIATEAGLFGIDEEAAAAGQFVNGAVRKLSDHPTHEYNSTAVARGRVFGLSRTGVKVLLPESQDVQLREVDVPRAMDTFSIPDFRRARIISTSRGFIVSSDELESFYYWDGELSAGSVFKSEELTQVVDVMSTPDGNDYFLQGGEDGSVFVMSGSEEGDFDTVDTAAASSRVYGGFTMLVPGPPDSNFVVRRVTGHVLGRGNAWLCVNGRGPSGRKADGEIPNSEPIAIPQLAPVVGTDSWGFIAPDPSIYADEEMTFRRRRFETVTAQFDERARAHTIELFVGKPGSRILPNVTVVLAGAGKRRSVT